MFLMCVIFYESIFFWMEIIERYCDLELTSDTRRNIRRKEISFVIHFLRFIGSIRHDDQMISLKRKPRSLLSAVYTRKAKEVLKEQ